MSNQSEPTSPAVTKRESESSIQKNVSHLMRQLDGIKIWDTKPELAKLKSSLSDCQKMLENKALATRAVDGKPSGSYADAVRRNVTDQSRDHPGSSTKIDPSSQQPTRSSDNNEFLPLDKTPVKTEDGMKKATGDNSVCATREAGKCTGTQPASSSFPKLSAGIEAAKDGSSVRSLSGSLKKQTLAKNLKKPQKNSSTSSSSEVQQLTPFLAKKSRYESSSPSTPSSMVTISLSSSLSPSSGETQDGHILSKSRNRQKTLKNKPVIRSVSRSRSPLRPEVNRIRTRSRSAETRKQKRSTANETFSLATAQKTCHDARGKRSTEVDQSGVIEVLGALISKEATTILDTSSLLFGPGKSPILSAGKDHRPQPQPSASSSCRQSQTEFGLAKADNTSSKGTGSGMCARKSGSSSRSNEATTTQSVPAAQNPTAQKLTAQKLTGSSKATSTGMCARNSGSSSRSNEATMTQSVPTAHNLTAQKLTAHKLTGSSKGISTGMCARKSGSSSHSNEATTTQIVPTAQNPTAQKLTAQKLLSAKATTHQKKVSTSDAGSVSPNKSFDKRGKQETKMSIAVTHPTPAVSPQRKITPDEKHIALAKGGVRTKSVGPSKPTVSGGKPASRGRSEVQVPSLTPPGKVKTTAKFYDEMTKSAKILPEKSPLMKLRKGTGSSDTRPRPSNNDQNLTKPAMSSPKPENATLRQTILKELRTYFRAGTSPAKVPTGSRGTGYEAEATQPGAGDSKNADRI